MKHRMLQLTYRQQNKGNEMYILIKQDGTTSEPMELFAAIKLKTPNERIQNAMSGDEVKKLYEGMK